MRRAQPLPVRHIPKQLLIVLRRPDMVKFLRRDNAALRGAFGAQRIAFQERVAHPPVAPRRARPADVESGDYAGSFLPPPFASGSFSGAFAIEIR